MNNNNNNQHIWNFCESGVIILFGLAHEIIYNFTQSVMSKVHCEAYVCMFLPTSSISFLCPVISAKILINCGISGDKLIPSLFHFISIPAIYFLSCPNGCFCYFDRITLLKISFSAFTILKIKAKKTNKFCSGHRCQIWGNTGTLA